MQEIKDLVFRTIEQCDSDEMAKIQGLIILHKIQKDLEEQIKYIKAWKWENLQDLENEAADYPDGYGGFTFEFRSGSKTFVYDGIKDYDDKKRELKALESLYKVAYDSLQKGITPVHADTGEILEIPTVKYRASSVILKPKK